MLRDVGAKISRFASCTHIVFLRFKSLADFANVKGDDDVVFRNAVDLAIAVRAESTRPWWNSKQGDSQRKRIPIAIRVGQMKPMPIGMRDEMEYRKDRRKKESKTN